LPKRLWIWIARTVLVPGWDARDRRPRLAIALLAGGVAFPVGLAAVALLSPRNWVALTLDSSFLLWVMVALFTALVSRLIAAAEWWQLRRAESPDRFDVWALAVVLAVSAPFLFGAVAVARARADIAPVFTPAPDGPLFDAAGTTTSSLAPTTSPPATSATTVAARPSGTTTTSSTIPPQPPRPRSGIDARRLRDVTTVLLLGGDAGPGRSGLRTDTMMLFCLHRPSGRAALISIPRDLNRLLFPPGSVMGERYPYGFDDMANAVYPIVSSRSELRDGYDDVEGVRPGVVALAYGLGYSLDVTIDDYVLVDMEGFLELIDALGGVTVAVSKAVPMPGNIPGAPTQYPATIGPGVIRMDGTTALGYVRSRKGDSDYQRTRRQRDLLAALATQISFDDVALSFGSVASAIGGTLRTSLTPDELADTLAVIGGETAIVESVGLVPPLVDVNRPDYRQLARIVGEVRLALVTGRASGW
jgi:LCP family protein required for cell wall assembly